MRQFRILLLQAFVVTTSAAVLAAAAPDTPVPIFRAETAEVHIAFTAFDKHDRPLKEISESDFTLYRDGEPLSDHVVVERRQDSPITVTVMTDVSASMEKAVPIARKSWKWMNTKLLQPDDRVRYFDFGARVSSFDGQQESPNRTSLYDCLLKVIPQVAKGSNGRRALIMFTDGIDNDSAHALEDVVRVAATQDVAVYAISTWKYKVKYDYDVLNRLASTTGGRFILVKDSNEMTAALQEITDELRNGYEAVFRADKASAGLHLITMQATNRHIHFYHRVAYYQPPVARDGVMLAKSGRRLN